MFICLYSICYLHTVVVSRNWATGECTLRRILRNFVKIWKSWNLVQNKTDLVITLERIQLSLFQGGELTDDHHLPKLWRRQTGTFVDDWRTPTPPLSYFKGLIVRRMQWLLQYVYSGTLLYKINQFQSFLSAWNTHTPFTGFPLKN